MLRGAGGFLSHVIHYVIIGVFLAFTASRQIEVFNLFIAPDQLVIKLCALTFTEGGVIGWAIYLRRLWKTEQQFYIATIMLGISIIAVLLGVLLDMYVILGHNGVITDNPIVVQSIIYGIMFVVAANIIAYPSIWMTSPQMVSHWTGTAPKPTHQAPVQGGRSVQPFVGGTQVQDVTPPRPQQKPAGPYQQPTQHPVPSLPSPRGMDDLPTRAMPKDFPQAQSSKNNGLSQQQVKNQQNGHAQTSFREYPTTRVLDQEE